MDITIQSIEYSPESRDVIDVGVLIGGDPMTRYRASFDDSDSRLTSCNIESDLFMALSNIAHAKYGQCTVFQIELMEMIRAFSKQEFDLELPVKLGTTKYCILKPTKLRVAYNKIRNWFTTLLWKIGVSRPKRGVEPIKETPR